MQILLGNLKALRLTAGAVHSCSFISVCGVIALAFTKIGSVFLNRTRSIAPRKKRRGSTTAC